MNIVISTPNKPILDVTDVSDDSWNIPYSIYSRTTIYDYMCISTAKASEIARWLPGPCLEVFQMVYFPRNLESLESIAMLDPIAPKINIWNSRKQVLRYQPMKPMKWEYLGNLW